MVTDASIPSDPTARKVRSRFPSWLPTLLLGALVYAVVAVANAYGWITQYWYGVIQMAVIVAISALGLNLIYGFNGQFSLGHVGFYAIGAYTSALVTKDYVSHWSGGQFIGLSWIIAGQVGVFLILQIIHWMRFGTVRAAVGEWLNAQMPRPEAFLLNGLVSLVLVGVAVAGGVIAAWGLQKGLLPLLNLLAGLPLPAGKPVVFVLGLLSGGALAAMVAYLVGLPLLRLSSDYLGIATLGFAVMVYTALQNSDQVIPTMKGARGMVGIPTWTNWTWGFAVLVFVIVVMRNLVHSSFGRAILSVRDDEVASRSVGIDAAQLKALAFATGAFFAGIAGGLYAHLYGFLHPSTFNFVKGFDPLIVVVFGGLGSMTGTLMASGLFVLIVEGLRVVLPQGFEDWRFVIYPVFLLLIMLLRQTGLLGNREWGWLQAPLPPERDAFALPVRPYGARAPEQEEGLTHV